jgi:Ser/Thr protein kinase RdoA (MazF antagonist)
MHARGFLDGRLRAFAEAALAGPAEIEADLSGPAGGSTVLALVARDGRRAVLKAHRSAAKHRREVFAYRAWAPRLAPLAARLLAEREAAPAAILLERVPGRAGLPDDDPAATTVHRRAGAWLARLHRLPVRSSDPLPLAAAYRRRAEGWTARAAPHLPAGTYAAARGLLARTLPTLAGRARVPCHRDVGPHNWLVEGDRLTGVVDLEHARPDVAEADLARLATTVWPRSPALREAFLAGYRAAGGPADAGAPWLPGLCLLEALGTVAWAARHGDPAGARAGRAALTRVLDEALA